MSNINEWRENELAIIPLLSQALFAPPSERGNTYRAIHKATIHLDPYTPLPLPKPIWINRPKSATQEDQLEKRYDGWEVRGIEKTEFSSDGHHKLRENGRSTRHARLDIARCEEAWRIYHETEQARRNEYNRIYESTVEEVEDKAVRLGTGWIMTRPYPTKKQYYIFEPETGRWWRRGRGAYKYVSYEDIEKEGIVEEVRCERTPGETMTFEQAQAYIRSLGFELQPNDHRTFTSYRVSYKGIYLGSFLGNEGVIDRVQVNYVDKEVSEENIRESIVSMLTNEKKRVLLRITEAQETLKILEEASP